MKKRPLVLIVLDGWGHRGASDHNAIAKQSPFFHSLLGEYPNTLLSASGEEVGLPLGLMGNSEVGHMNLGAGRVVFQDITRIDRSIQEGDFFENGTLVRTMDQVRQGGGRLHLLGLVSDGGVHSSDLHLRSLLELAKKKSLRADEVFVHAILDGRDTPPRSGAKYIEALEKDLERVGVGRIVSVIGRYWAMDRDQRWERIRRAYDLFVSGEGFAVDSAGEAVRRSYQVDDKGDEFLEPYVVGHGIRGRMQAGDHVLAFNFRADRMRQILMALGPDDFDGFERKNAPDLKIATMTQYRADFPFPVVFPPIEMKGMLSEVLAREGLSQERIAETEKYAHVTFFFSGGKERPVPGESRILVPSPKVATYDLKPEMSAFEVCDKVLLSLDRGATDVYIINLANADMVGHTGVWDAACKAVKAVDQCLERIVPKVVEAGGLVAVTSDHGNAEMLWDEENDQPHTAHTTNPVPIVLCSRDLVGAKLRPMGVLSDVVPTLLEMVEIEKSPQMDGTSLVSG